MFKKIFLNNPQIIISRRKLSEKKQNFLREAELTDLIPAIVIHGGISNDFTAHAPYKMASMVSAINRGFSVLKITDNSVDAVEATMIYMEDNMDFNVGYGSMLNENGEVEMDSCIMCGNELGSGAVGCISDVRNPVLVARSIMEETSHVLMCCEGAKEFAKNHSFEIVTQSDLVTDRSRYFLKERTGGDIGNAGVVAIDSRGRVAACSGSGGPIGRTQGRCGDCCRIGCSIYADNKIGAICVAGDGNYILKYLLAFATIKGMESGLSTIQSMDKHMRQFQYKFGKPAGAIGFDRFGHVAIHFTSRMMPWAYRSPSEFMYGSTIKELPAKYRDYT